MSPSISCLPILTIENIVYKNRYRVKINMLSTLASLFHILTFSLALRRTPVPTTTPPHTHTSTCNTSSCIHYMHVQWRAHTPTSTRTLPTRTQKCIKSNLLDNIFLEHICVVLKALLNNFFGLRHDAQDTFTAEFKVYKPLKGHMTFSWPAPHKMAATGRPYSYTTYSLLIGVRQFIVYY